MFLQASEDLDFAEDMSAKQNVGMTGEWNLARIGSGISIDVRVRTVVCVSSFV